MNRNEPDARIADVMLAKEDGLYFVTARGKPYYKQLQENKNIALCCMDKDYTLFRIIGEIVFSNNRTLVDEVFKENPMMNDIYRGDKREILEPFHLFKGRGEIFSLSEIPARRERFAFGSEKIHDAGYVINDLCIQCGNCVDVCPTGAVGEIDTIYLIDRTTCLECGGCYEICPSNAIDEPEGL